MKKIIFGALISVLLLVVFCVTILFVVHHSTKQLIFERLDGVEATTVGVVFGAGIVENENPSDMLYDRLSIAAYLYNSELITTILISGANPTEDYNEPQVMHDTLVETFEIPKEDIEMDFAGLRTYDTCVRAKNLWGVDEAILISQKYHLPRAIWTCKKLDIDSIGYSATLRPYLNESHHIFRETLAKYKAFIDLYIYKPRFISGEIIKDL